MKVLIQICRLIVGSLFIVSGLIKANDALGFSYKLQEYFSPDVLGMEWLGEFALPMAMLISIVEIALGVGVIMAIRMRLVSWSLLLMIIFFTFLTFYSAYFDKVTDCGCFGDALKLTPWQSFTKDLLLLVFIVPIFMMRNKIEQEKFKESLILVAISAVLIFGFSAGVLGWSYPVLFFIIMMIPVMLVKKILGTVLSDNLQLGIGVLIPFIFTIYCFLNLPVRDFRPYAIGKSIPEQMKIPDGAPQDVYETILTYKNSNTNEVKDFTASSYPWNDSTWVWVSTETNLISKGFETAIHDFDIETEDGNNYTEDILAEPYIFLLVSYDITNAAEEVQQKINEFAAQVGTAGYYFYGLTASLYNDVEEFRHNNQNEFDYYTVDGITLKTIIRSNPGLVLLKEGVVIGKWHYRNLPKFEDVKNQYLN